MTLLSFDKDHDDAAQELANAAPELAQAEFGLELVTDDPAQLRAAFSRFPSGIAALCATVDDAPAGMVATSFSVGVSFDPPLVMFSVQNSSTTWPRLRTAPQIGVSILGREHAKLASQLASRNGDRFAGVDTLTTPSRAILIRESAIWMECEILSETPAGDHHIVVLEVKSIRVEHDVEPLIYHASKFRHLSEAV